jgi:hypothetical protein
MDKWLIAKIPSYYIMVSDDYNADCPSLQKYVSKKLF